MRIGGGNAVAGRVAQDIARRAAAIDRFRFVRVCQGGFELQARLQDRPPRPQPNLTTISSPFHWPSASPGGGGDVNWAVGGSAAPWDLRQYGGDGRRLLINFQARLNNSGFVDHLYAPVQPHSCNESAQS